MIYRGRGVPMDIKKAKDNFDKDGKSKCFNYNIYRHMIKDCRKLKREQNTKKCYKCNKMEHITKDCRIEQKMKNCSIQEETDNKKNEKQEDFRESSK